MNTNDQCQLKIGPLYFRGGIYRIFWRKSESNLANNNEISKQNDRVINQQQQATASVSMTMILHLTNRVIIYNSNDNTHSYCCIAHSLYNTINRPSIDTIDNRSIITAFIETTI